jgi:hypothetical protein
MGVYIWVKHKFLIKINPKINGIIFSIAHLIILNMCTMNKILRTFSGFYSQLISGRES